MAPWTGQRHVGLGQVHVSCQKRRGSGKPNVPLENQPFSDRGLAPYPRRNTTVATAPATPHSTTDTTASTSAAFIVLVFIVPRFMNPK